ncbi:hypothetical protein PsYK624_112340 [Phanerochaete sordida]|uniref:Uncharacterized protein n=1 Tax=Phanerochaete sordida TaxID=48140 RepID=A0A9P3GK66_9APHY|nr:hypothetical protein PsYK624_112340 [Phanerochaete sordida]
MKTHERLWTNIVFLRIAIVTDDAFEVIRSLPQLRELVVTSIACYENPDLRNEAYSIAPRMNPVNRTLALLELRNGYMWVAEWLLQLFTAVDTLALREIWRHDHSTVIHAARHIVKNLELQNVGTVALSRMHEFLDLRNVLGMVIHAQIPSEWSTGHEEAMQDVILPASQSLKSVHYLESTPREWMPKSVTPPSFVAFKSLTSVTLTTDAFNRALYPLRWPHALRFLDTLPLNIATIELIYTDFWAKDEILVSLIRQIDWTAIACTLEKYTQLRSLRIGSERKSQPRQYWKCAPLVNNKSARDAVLEGLPDYLRAVTVFV